MKHHFRIPSVTLIYTALIAGVFACSHVTSAIGAEEDEPAPTRTVLFKTIGDVQLNLHLFEPAGHKASDRRPAIVFFFGGGWNGGTPNQFYPQSQYLASRGMLAAAAEYRVNRVHGTSPFECVADGKSAVRWMRAHADELGIDPDRLAAGGGSAGGHVAATTGTIKEFDEPAEDASVSSVPNALVLFNPVIDTGPEGYGYERLKDRYASISPVEHVTPDVPPTIIFHGTADTTVPVANVIKFDKRMKAAGNRSELMTFDGEKHGFFNVGRGGTDANYFATVRAMDEFLASLGYLSGPPTINTAP